MPHVGHLNLLKRARDLGDELYVGVLTDEAASAYKPMPIVPFGERIRLVQAYRWVTCAIPQEDTNATYLFDLVHPDILVHGDDWKPGWEMGQTWIEAHGGKFVLLPYTPGVSSTSIKQRIAHTLPPTPDAGRSA